MSERPPRYRYVVFRIEGPRAFTRAEVLEALHRLPDRPWLVEFDGTRGIVRTTNLERDATVRSMTSIASVAAEAVRVTTVGTSGTIRKAEEKYLSPRGARSRAPRKKAYK